jgi:hypothetical protein
MDVRMAKPCTLSMLCHFGVAESVKDRRMFFLRSPPDHIFVVADKPTYASARCDLSRF